MQREVHGPVELAPDLAHDVVLLENLDRIAEVIAEQHRRDRNEADQHGRYRQRDQRNRHDERALVRVAAMAVIVMPVSVIVSMSIAMPVPFRMLPMLMPKP